MSTVHSLTLAGDMEDFGNGWISMFEGWGSRGLQAGLIVLVVIVMIQKFSLKAGIGALLLMIIAMGLYNSREDLADMFTDEVRNPSKAAPALPGIVRASDQPVRVHLGGAGGWL
ncbi:hypothetical protein [Streptomyces sp. MN13]